ncbi:MAG: flavodoxin family protein [Deltaproteobacteria bacterium]|nr:flavodoxin family protein [Deltaproteobacteria bacterium]MBW2051197.1 flavodoxin family protein [Deltaproteobacteria bacterium]MBW2139838.1 flavodoxin family protein [Deltaproteobacteria bacterium]
MPDESKAVRAPVLALQGSPRRGGNTDLLLDETLTVLTEKRVVSEKVVLRDLKISPCLEIYACLKDGQCAIKDDMIELYDKLNAARVLIVASPIFFYGPCAQLKAVIDRCQAMWSRKYRLNWKTDQPPGRGYVISASATLGKKVFDGLLLTVKYFFDVLNLEFGGQVLVRGVDLAGEVFDKPEALSQARELGGTAVEFINRE